MLTIPLYEGGKGLRTGDKVLVCFFCFCASLLHARALFSAMWGLHYPFYLGKAKQEVWGVFPFSLVHAVLIIFCLYTMASYISML